LRWISTLEDIPYGAWQGEPIAWLFNNADVDACVQTRPASEDLADCAVVGIDRGGWRLDRLGRIRLLSAHAMGIHLDEIRLQRREKRGLAIVAPKRTYVSDTSRGAWGAVAIAGTPVGIDVEEFPTDGPLPLNLLHAEEREFLMALDPITREHAFLRFWTAREAYLKAAGLGLAEVLDTVRACAREGGIVELKRGAASLGLIHTTAYRNCIAALAAPDLGKSPIS
jgi:phosphopantetheinyl transferase